MKIEKKKVKEMKELMDILSKSDRELTPKGRARLKELSAYFLAIATISQYTRVKT